MSWSRPVARSCLSRTTAVYEIAVAERQQKGITSNVTRLHSTVLTGTTTIINHALWQPSAHRIRVRDEEATFWSPTGTRARAPRRHRPDRRALAGVRALPLHRGRWRLV
jgi:hypothetical protein